MAGKNIHKGKHHHNDCEHNEDEYLLSCTTKTKSGENIKWDCYMFDNSDKENDPAKHSLCLRMGDSGNYISTDLNTLIKTYLMERTDKWY